MGAHSTTEHRRRLVARWHASNLSMAAFAREHGLRPGTFASWVRDVSPPPPRPSEPPAFLAVVATAGVARAETFSVHFGDVALRFEGPPSPVWFAAVLRELAPC